MPNFTRRDLLRSGAAITAASLVPGTHVPAAAEDAASNREQRGAEQAHPSNARPVEYLLNMVHHNPGEPQFITKYSDPAYLRSIGYTGQTDKIYIAAAITYDRYAPGLIAQQGVTWAWIERYAHNLDHLIQIHRQKQMPIYPFTDVLVLPRELMQAYGAEITGPDGRLSIQRPRTQELVRAQMENIFRRFPHLDGLTTRFGETYTFDLPFHTGSSPVHTSADHTVLIRLLREELCVKRNKKLFYRTWDFDGLHTHPDQYLAATDPVEPHPNLAFSIKHTNADFIRGVPLNKTLGIGRHRQVVEVSMMQAGCYGKGAYPYYIGRGVLHGWPEMHPPRGIDQLVRRGAIQGIYTWARGDGWSGPYISNEFWVDLNLYVVSQFGHRPWMSDRELFDEYCRTRLKIDRQSAEKLYELCLLSEHAAYIGTQSAIAPIQPWWQRDDHLGDPDLHGLDHAKLLAEKAQAVAEWKRIEALAREIRLADSADQEFLEVSSTWGRIYFSIIEQLWTMQVLASEERDAASRAQLRRSLAAYDRLWAEWHKLERDHACCSTLYQTFWPVKFPPTWREHPHAGKQKPTHDTPLVSRVRQTLNSAS